MLHRANFAALPGSRHRIWKVPLISAGFFLLLAIVFFLRIGHWLVVEDPLKKARAIAVLSGRMPMRALEAAKLFREGNASEVWLTRSSEPGDTLAAMGISYVGEDFYNLRVLIHEGVPADAIRVLKPSIINTADEMNVIATALANEKDRTVILVTSKAHTRRTRTLWRSLERGKGQAIVRAASGDPFEPGSWWHTTGDALDVVREVLGLLNAWAGLPLPPAV
jgi:uncharacterized SAM-binding protein YcdF (DUF218 family)